MVANYHAPEEKDFEDSIDCLEAFDVKNIIYQKDILFGVQKKLKKFLKFTKNLRIIFLLP